MDLADFLQACQGARPSRRLDDDATFADELVDNKWLGDSRSQAGELAGLAKQRRYWDRFGTRLC
jgi:hypothetical protein